MRRDNSIVPYRGIVFTLALFGAAITAGCRHGNDNRVEGVGTDAGTARALKAAPLDLSKSLAYRPGVGISGLAPLSFSEQLAASAHGAWIVFATKPLEDVKTPQPQPGARGNPFASITVQQALDLLQKSGTPMSWDSSRGYMLLDYAPNRDVDRIRAAPPAETVGVMVYSESMPELARAVGDVWRIKLEISPDVAARLDSFRAERRELATYLAESNPAGSAAAPYSAAQFGGDDTGDADSDSDTNIIDGFHFTALERLDLAGLLGGLAKAMGGEAVDLGDGKWRIAFSKDAQKNQAEVQRLKESIDQIAGAAQGGFTSFAERSGESSGDEQDVGPVPVPDVSDAAKAAFMSLGMHGDDALPVLTAYLDSEKPQTARIAEETLASMSLPVARAAVDAFLIRLRTPCKAKTSEPMRLSLLSETLRLVTKWGGAKQTLIDIALDQSATPRDRMGARMACAAHGDISSFATQDAPKLGEGLFRHNVKYPPEPGRPQEMKPSTDPTLITPIATARAPGGDVWSIFLSARLGNALDIWLAHGKDGKWIEFLFTGKQFTRSQQYGNAEITPGPGSCLLEATADTVTLKPPNASNAVAMADLTKHMNDPKLTNEARQKLYTQFNQLQQKVANVLDKPIPLKIADLKKDADGDGLPDLVEQRLGLDPKKADTDGDGVKDGVDPSPLSGKSAPSPRSTMLQQIFTVLYGKDESPAPIIVELERDKWQKFTDARAQVICVTHKQLLKFAHKFSALRILQFGGPHDAASTILHKDGPCLFNDNKTLAQVDFWAYPGSDTPTARRSRRMYYNNNTGSETPIEYTARFEFHSDWKLVSVSPAKVDSVEKAVSELTQWQQLSTSFEDSQ